MTEVLIKWVGIVFFAGGGLYMIRLGRFFWRTKSITSLIKAVRQDKHAAPWDIRVLMVFQTVIMPGFYDWMYKAVGERHVDRLMRWGGVWIGIVGCLGIVFAAILTFLPATIFAL